MSGVLAIIPARGGSKRIPRKNIREFCGIPIIAYSIGTAIQSNCFDEVMVSTDDQEIAEVAKKYGASVPFLRDPITSNDHAGIADVVLEVLEMYKTIGRFFDAACCILPTAPLLRSCDLLAAKEVLIRGAYDTVFPVVRFSYPIQRALKREGELTTMIWPENYLARSQDLLQAYHDSGLFYWLSIPIFITKKRMFTDNSGSIELPETQVQDVDTEEDWQICEMKYRLLSNKDVGS